LLASVWFGFDGVSSVSQALLERRDIHIIMVMMMMMMMFERRKDDGKTAFFCRCFARVVVYCTAVRVYQSQSSA
jgi:hypothetical protein